jgi:hypothetical protein
MPLAILDASSTNGRSTSHNAIDDRCGNERRRERLALRNNQPEEREGAQDKRSGRGDPSRRVNRHLEQPDQDLDHS